METALTINYENDWTAKYRPRNPNELFGQPTAQSQLEGIFRTGKVPRAIMLSGVFGTGKTTCARMIARTLNCLESGPHVACLTCRSCEQMSFSPPAHSDLVEINAAEARGIGEIRELANLVNLSPQTNYKVFVLDECHQLTKDAANAFLKMLEEPSPRTIFILCTTAPDRVLPAIRSRCMRIQLLPVAPPAMMPLLQRIRDGEQLAFPDEALLQIAIHANGHPRDAIKLLQTVANEGYTADGLMANLPQIVQRTLSMSADQFADRYLRALFDADYGATLKLAAMVPAQTEAPVFLRSVVARLQAVNQQLFCGGPQTPTTRMHEPLGRELVETLGKFPTLAVGDLSDLFALHTRASERAKDYMLEPDALLHEVALQGLTILARLSGQ